MVTTDTALSLASSYLLKGMCNQEFSKLLFVFRSDARGDGDGQREGTHEQTEGCCGDEGNVTNSPANLKKHLSDV